MINNNSLNAPLILFCYNRLESLKKVISSLQSDYQIQNTDVYIFSDGPKLNSSLDTAKVNEVRKYLYSLEKFSKSITIFEHNENQGLANSIIYGINKVSAHNQSFIVLEDDLITSPNFLTYMNKSLNKYADEKKVWAINGMGFNPNIFNMPKDYKYDTYFTYRNSSHGWGSWTDRWGKAILDISVLKNDIFESTNQLDFNRGGEDLTPMLVDQIEGKIDSWAIRWIYNISKNNGVCLAPVYSYVSLTFEDGRHVKGYVESLDNNLDLAKNEITYPKEIKVLSEIARAAALVFVNKVPLLLQKNLKEKSEYKKYLKRKKSNPKITGLTASPFGGAAKAAINSAKSIELNTDISVEILSQYSTVDSIYARKYSHNNLKLSEGLFSIFNKNIYEGNTIFTPSYHSLSFSDLDNIVNNSDLIHLHWMPGYLSNEAIAYLSRSNKPVVWTFHDINPLTGGCHYFHGCDKWKTDCYNCPQLKNTFDNFPMRVLKAKIENFNFQNITVIVTNEHFKKLVQKSPMFENSRIETISYCIETEIFKPLDTLQIQKKYNLPVNKKIILFAASYKSKIKGFQEFIKSVGELKGDNYHILIVGSPQEITNLKYSYTFWENVDENQMVDAYNLANVTVVSSIEDNLPNVMLESLSCGTPVVGFKVGGLKDNIIDNFNGQLVTTGDTHLLAEAIENIINGPSLSKNCRNFALDNFSFKSHSLKLSEVYRSLIANKKESNLSTATIPEHFDELDSTYKYLMRKVKRNENKWIKFLKSSLKNKLQTIFKKLLKI
jgi:glycosyltransferase involved in cell wall biosynthesis